MMTKKAARTVLCMNPFFPSHHTKMTFVDGHTDDNGRFIRLASSVRRQHLLEGGDVSLKKMGRNPWIGQTNTTTTARLPPIHTHKHTHQNKSPHHDEVFCWSSPCCFGFGLYCQFLCTSSYIRSCCPTSICSNRSCGSDVSTVTFTVTGMSWIEMNPIQ